MHHVHEKQWMLWIISKHKLWYLDTTRCYIVVSSVLLLIPSQCKCQGWTQQDMLHACLVLCFGVYSSVRATLRAGIFLGYCGQCFDDFCSHGNKDAFIEMKRFYSQSAFVA